MPKEQPARRFRLAYEVDAAELGVEVAALTERGRTNVNFELIEDVRTFAKKTNHETKAEDFLGAWIADHPTFKAGEPVKAFQEVGRTAGACYSALRILVEKKILKKLEPGNYARADIKHLAAPKKKAAHAQRYEVSHKDFILRAARRAHGRFSAAKVKDLFEKDGRNRDSVSTAINELLAKKQIKRVSEGEYVLLTKPTPTPAAKPNGADAPVVEAAHG